MLVATLSTSIRPPSLQDTQSPPIHLIDVLRLGSFSPKIQDTLEEFGTVADARLTKKKAGGELVD